MLKSLHRAILLAAVTTAACCAFLRSTSEPRRQSLLLGPRSSFQQLSQPESFAAVGDLSATNLTETQLPYVYVSDEALGLPPDLRPPPGSPALAAEIPGRRILRVVRLSELSSLQLTNELVPLPQANTLGHLNYQARRVGRLSRGNGEPVFFNPEVILVKLRSLQHVAALRVEPMRELEALKTLKQRDDLEFAELDVFERRQALPNDPLLTNQWHHSVMNSFGAWDKALGKAFIQIAIVDTPFQTDHPDLAANTVPGWDAVANVPVTSSPGIVHSTMCAGMAAAVINNSTGVAGAANCKILPININGAISEMYNAVIWAADHGVRVVNISWSGANSDTLEAAGYYLKTHAKGILAMAAIDGTGFLNWTNQPDIHCVSMTDAADNFQLTKYGPYVDFAAPGYQVYSTSTGGGYAYGTGTSYATPLFCGVAAWLFGLNPTLGPDELIEILKDTAINPVSSGWNQYYGWGRISFGSAADMTLGTLPLISSIQISNHQATVSFNFKPGLVYSLWRGFDLSLGSWVQVTNTTVNTNGSAMAITDLSPLQSKSFYRIQAALP